MIEARLRTRISAAELDNKVGKIVGDQDYNMVLTGAAKLLRPNGQPLCIYLPGAVRDLMDDADIYAALTSMRNHRSDNRGLASGTARVKETSGGNASRALNVPSTIVGSIEATGRYKYCRLTAWTGHNLPLWETLHPLLQGIARHFRQQLPERYAAQQKEADNTHAEWVVPGTPFTTVTVNNCVDADTQCLSLTKGWTHHTDLQVGDYILAYNPETHTTRWEPVTHLHVDTRYHGEITELTARGFSACTTPDHRWPLRPPTWRRTSGHTVMYTRELPYTHYWSLLRSAPHECPTARTHDDAFVRVLAHWVADGSGPAHAHTGHAATLRTQAHPASETAASIREDLDALVGTGHLSYDEYGRPERPTAATTWELRGPLVANLIADAPHRVPTMSFLASLTRAQLVEFIDLLSSTATGCRRIQQSDSTRMDAITAAAVLSGYAPTLDSTGTRCSLRASHSTHDGARINLRSVKRTTRTRACTVWCPTVPSGHWVARRDGTTYITGNSYATGVHQDAGDLDAGFSTLACLRRGEYTGGRLVFPRYRVAVDMQHGDLLLMDAHEWHGNTRMTCPCSDKFMNGLCRKCGAERISVVSYFRSNMVKCGTSDDEFARAARIADSRTRKRLAAALDSQETP